MLKRIFTFILSLLSLQVVVAQCYSLPSYCAPTVVNDGINTNMGMQNVTFGTLVNNSVATGGYPHYYDYTNMTIGGAAGSKIYGSVKNGSGNSTMVRIFVDWNQDGVYGTTFPELNWASYNSAANAVVNDTLSIPTGQTPGLYRIRVQGNYGAGTYGTTGTVNPCMVDYGEIEEYTLIVTSSTPDASVLYSLTPTYFVAGNNTVAFTLANLTDVALTSVNIGYQLGTNTAVTQSLTGLNVASGATYAATFSTALNISSVGSYSLKIWLNNVNGAGTQTPSNDTTCRSFAVYCGGPLSGTYTIDPISTGSNNFKSISAADSAMITCGINGPVVFNVAPWTYNEQIDIPAISGASATNTITFDGGNGNTSTRILTYATTSTLPFVLRFNNCNYVTFRNMTIRATGTTNAWVVQFLDGTNNKLNNCVVDITGSGATSTSTTFAGVVINGSSSSLTASSVIANNHSVDSCSISSGYYNVYCSTSAGANVLNFNGNTMSSAYYYGMYLNSSCTAKIRNNSIDLRTSNPNNEGIHLINCNASGFHEIISNKITNAGQYGMFFQTSSGSSSGYGQIYNNMIGGGFRNTNGYYGINDNSSRWQIWHNSFNLDFAATSGTTAAVYLSGGSLHDIQNNHFAVTNAAAVNAYCFYTTSSSYVSVLDFNNYYNASSINLLNIGGTNVTSLNYKTGFGNNGGGSNSISLNPFYIGATNLHTTMACNNGANLGLTKDFDGDSRSSSPDIGADEVTSTSSNDIGILKINSPTFPLIAGSQSINVTIRNYGSNTITSANVKYQINGGSVISAGWTGSLNSCDTANYTFSVPYTFTTGSYNIKAFTSSPNGTVDANTSNDTVQTNLCPAFGGNYTIDPAGSGANNFTTFNNAVSALSCGGVYAPVTFTIATGTYVEQVSIPAILGVNAQKNITFKSATGVASDVTLINNATSSAGNYTLRLNGANFINFDDFTIAASNVNFGTALLIVNNSSIDTFYNMVFTGVTTTSNTTNHSVIYCPSGISNFLYFDLCKVNNGAYGSYFSSNGNATSTENLTFNNCDFSNQYSYGMYNSQLNGLILNNNRIVTNSSYTNYIGMYNYYIFINTLANRPVINANKISGSVGGVGMYNMYFGISSSTTGKRPIISNNMINVGSGANSTYGIQVVFDYGSDYIHNTVSIGTTQNTNASAAAYFQSNSSAVDSVVRNIFVGLNGAPAIRCDAIASFNPCNFNNLFTTGANLGYLNATGYTTLALWRTGSGRDANSINVNPGFVSATDLHIASATNLLNVTPHILVPNDIDGVLRCGNTTDIGADHHPGTNDIGISRVLFPVNGVAAPGARDIVVVLRNMGTNTITSANVSYKDASTTKTIAWTGVLNLCDSAVVTFTGANQYTFTGAWSLKYFTDSPNGTTDGNKTNDTISAVGCTGLAGVYTINPTGSGSTNYTSFTAAINAMTSCGVGGPVVFNVAAGSYNEQVSIGNVNGTSPTNTITFDGGNGNVASRILTFTTTAAAPYVWRFNASQFVVVRNLTIRGTDATNSWNVNFLNASNCRVERCNLENTSFGTTGSNSNVIAVLINGNTTSSSTSSTVAGNNYVDSCNIVTGYAGIMSYMNNANLTNYFRYNNISNFYFYGCYATGAQVVKFLNNNVGTRNPYQTNTYSLNLSSCSPAAGLFHEISNNKFSPVTYYAINITSCTGAPNSYSVISNNFIYSPYMYPSNSWSIYISSCNYWKVYHNSVNYLQTGNYTTYGLYVINGSFIDVRNNILASSETTNNVYTPCYVNPITATSFLDNNIYYNAGGTILASLGGINYGAANYKTAGAGANSLNVNPFFVSNTNLHVTMPCNNGANLGTTFDIDGDARGTSPDIGADEMSSIPNNDIGVMKINSPKMPYVAGTQTINVTIRNYGNNAVTSASINYRLNGGTAVTQSWTGNLGACDTANFTFTTTGSFPVGANNLIVYTSGPNGVSDANVANDTAQWTICNGMSGAYTINPSGSGATNFTSFTAAANALGCGGVYGPVVITVAASTYNEQVSIPFIVGASATNTITFEGFNAATRIISYTTTAALPYVLRFNACDYVTFRNFTIRGTGSTTTWVTNFLDGTNNRVSNCIIDFTGTGVASTSTAFIPVLINGNTTSSSTNTILANNHMVDSCVINYGYYAVYSAMSTDGNKLSIINNTFNGPYQYGFYSTSGSYQPRVIGNTFNMRSGASGSTTSQGIFIQSCSNSGNFYMEVSNNKVLNAGQYGIYLNSCLHSGSVYNQIYNNMIGGGFRNVSTTSGMFLQSVNRAQVYHNSVNMDAPTTGGINAALYFNSGSNNDARNNNLSVSNPIAVNAYSLYLSATGVLTNLDNNNYYNRSSTNLVSFGGTNYNSSNFRTAFPAGAGVASMSFDPYYLSSLNLHTTSPCYNGANLGITKDIDGQTRATVPDIGADEIVSVPNNDIGVMKINTPSFPLLAGSQTINVTLRNYGNNVDTSAIINYQVNGSTVVSQTWTGTLAPCDTLNFSFTAPYTFTAGVSVVKVFTTSPNGASDAVTANDTIQISLCSAMSGAYTINPTGSGSTNYTSFTNAINALTCGGIVGPVTFNVAAATYTEQLVIPPVPGASTTNTITFDGGAGNYATRVITFAGTALIPATLFVNTATNITFKNLTFQSTGVAQGWAVNLFNTKNCRISNCSLEVAAPGNASTSTVFMAAVIGGGNTTGNYTTASTLSDNNMIDSSIVKSGYYGIYTSINNGAFTNYFLRNTVLNQYQGGMYFNGAQTVKCNYNDINLFAISNANSDAITLTSVSPAGTQFNEVNNNKILYAGRYGIYLPSSAGSVSSLGQVYNNFVGGGFQNTAACGIYINSTRWNVYHNTVNLDAPITTTAACMYFAGGGTNDVRNNIFAVTGTNNANAVPLYTSSTANITTLDYNNYYNALGVNLLNLGGTFKTAATFKAAYSTGGGLASVNFNPSFISNTNLHILGGCNNGVNLSIGNDFDGDTRGTTPDMGADEMPNYTLDAMVLSIRTPTGLLVTGGTPYTVKVLVRNNGATTITSMDASFSINGVATTQTFTSGTGLPAAGLVACDTVQLTFTSSAIFNAGGPGFFKAYTGNLNGSADQFHANDTLSNLFCTPFAGNYTINANALPSGTNFTSFKAAVSAIYSCGVAGPVVFRAVPGSGPYVEQLTFTGAIPGATAINTVTFHGGSNREAISFNAGVAATQHTIRINGAKHIILDSLTINALNITNGIGVNITGLADSNFVQNCVLNIAGSTATNTAGITLSSTASPTGAANNGNKNIIQRNTINGGYYGITAIGTNTATFCNNNQIIGNTINGSYQYGMYLLYQDNIKINSNNIASMSNLNVNNYGISLQYIDRFELKKNRVNNVGTYGIYIASFANYQNNAPSSRASIVNNMVGGTFYNTSGYGIYLGTNSRDIDILHNSVSVMNAGSIYAFFMQQTTTLQYSNLDVRNNSFVIYNGSSYAAYFYYGSATTTPFLYFNNNNFWNSNTAATQVVIQQSGYNTSGWIGALGYNANSKWLDPQYLNPANNLHTLGGNLNDVGVNVASVTEDFDGETRPINPSTIVDIGADEYNRPANDAGVVAVVAPAAPMLPGLQDVTVLIKNFGTNTLTSADVYYKVGVNGSVKSTTWSGSLANNATTTVTFTTPNQYNFLGLQVDTVISWTGLPNGQNDDYKANDTLSAPVCKSLNGAYTINPAGSGATNFVSFAAALQALNTCGVAGPVNITVAPGVYTGKLFLTPIPNATAANRVTFDGLDSAACKIIDIAGGTAAQPAVITFSGADFITFKNFGIVSTGVSVGVGVLMQNGADYNKIISCNIRVSETSTNSNCFGFGVCGNNYSTSGANGNYNAFESNAVIGGYVGASLMGSSTTVFDAGNTIRNCNFTNMYQYGVYAYYEFQDSLLGNTIRFRSNAVNSCVGMYVYYNNGVRVERNTIYNAGQNAIYSYFTNYTGPNLGSKAAFNNNIMITNTNYGSPITFWAYYCYNTEIYYNTAFCGGTSSTSSYAANISYPNNTDVRNNIFYNNNTTSAYALNTVSGTFNTFDYNIMYVAGGANYVSWLGVAIPDLPSLKAVNPALHQRSLNLIPNFVSTTLLSEDMHLNTLVAGQIADKTVPVYVDVDNEPRCNFSPTIGADESKYNSGNPVAGFTAPDTVFVNNQVAFLNNNLPTLPLGHRWYVDGVLVGTGTNLLYTFPATGTYAVKLFTYACVGTDSITKNITVYLPTQKPVCDFVADKYVVETYQQIQFTDLSKNGPAYWYWTFTPSAGVNYNNGTNNNSKNPVVSFSNPGLYEVCLWDSNAIGRSATVCKTAYILVNATNQLCIFPFDTKVPTGVLYDDGGPTGNYSANGTCNFLIDPCASSVTLTFSQFNLAGSAYLRIYNGKNNLAPALHTGLGFTGNALPGGANGITASSGKMYIEFVKGATVAAGFAASWTSVASTSSAPVGKIIMPDTAYDCGAYTNFSYKPSSIAFDRDGATYRWWFDYANSSAFPDVENKGAYSQDWSYGSTGSYIIRCDIEGCGGIETLYDTIEIVHPTTGPIVDFSADLLVGTPADVINLTDLSKIDPIWWQWTINGPGQVNTVTGSANSKNYGVQFPTPGIYSITLKDSNCVAANSLTKVAYIRIIDYCIPVVGVLNADFSIERFKLGRADTIINNNVFGLDYTNISPAVGSTTYRDNTNKFTSYLINNVTVANTPVLAWLGLGESIDFTVKRQSNFNNTNFKIWVDYNQDGIFQNSEQAASSGITSGITYSGQITVPTNATLGYTRLRIGTNFDSLSNTPCGVNTFGDFNDFRVFITPDITAPAISVVGNVDTVFVEVGRTFVDPGVTVTGATTVTHSGLAFNTVISAFPSLATHTITASDAANNTSVRTIYVRATKDITKPVISKIGADTLYLEVKNTYTDPGATATDFFFGTLTSAIVTTSNLNPNVLGTYTILYNVTDAAGNAATTVKRTVIVRDTQKPVIVISGPNPLYVNVHNTFNTPSATVTDNYNIALSYTVTGGPVNTNVLGTYQLFYSAADSSGNIATSQTLTVIVRDVTAPRITLLPADTVVIDCITLTSIPEPGYVVKDDYYPSNQITVSKTGTVNLNVVGLYSLRYYVSDPSGNIDSSAVRFYKVVDREAPVISLVGALTINWPRWKPYVDPGTTVLDKCDPGALVLKDESNLNIQLEGLYHVSYTCTDASGNKATMIRRYVNVYTPTGINVHGASDLFNIYPNPNNGLINIDINIEEATTASIRIFDANGKEVYFGNNIDPINNKLKIDLSQQAAGIYFVNLVTDKYSVSKSFSIQK